MTIRLRPYQQTLVTDVRAAWDGGAQNVVLQMATGGGKSACMGYLIESHKGASALIAHRNELVSQLSLCLAQYQVTHNIIANDTVRREIAALHVSQTGRCYFNPSARAAVASVQTLVRREVSAWASQVSFWVADEGHHHVVGNQWHTATELFRPDALGLLPTATPSRADGKGLGRHVDGIADVMVQGPSPKWLIEQGYLTDYRVICPQSDLKVLADVAASGDWSQKALKEASQRSHIVGDVVASYLANARGRIGATFTTDVETATKMAAAYNAAGVPAEVLTGETDARTRAGVMKRLERREILQICVVDIISEGVDLPALEVISVARPTMSLGLWLQIFGRVLRPLFAHGMPLDTADQRIAAQIASAKGRFALIIDHVGNFVRHQGGPDTPRIWSLDRREKRASSAPVDAIPLRVCLSCIQPFERHFTECPYCGAGLPEPISRASPKFVDGDMFELDRATIEALRRDATLPTEGEYRATLMASGLPEIPMRANIRRHGEKCEAQAALRDAMAIWGGRWHAAGETDRQIQKRFYLTYGIATLEAMALGRADAVALTARIESCAT